MRKTCFNTWARYFVCNFKGYLWNSTQNVLPIHWPIWYSNIELLRALRFKSWFPALKWPLICCWWSVDDQRASFPLPYLYLYPTSAGVHLHIGAEMLSPWLFIITWGCQSHDSSSPGAPFTNRDLLKHIPSAMWDEFTYPFPKFNGWPLKFGNGHFILDVITDPCPRVVIRQSPWQPSHFSVII